MNDKQRKCKWHDTVGCSSPSKERIYEECFACVVKSTLEEIECMTHHLTRYNIPLAETAAAYEHLRHITSNLDSFRMMGKKFIAASPEVQRIMQEASVSIRSLEKMFGRQKENEKLAYGV